MGTCYSTRSKIFRKRKNKQKTLRTSEPVYSDYDYEYQVPDHPYVNVAPQYRASNFEEDSDEDGLYEDVDVNRPEIQNRVNTLESRDSAFSEVSSLSTPKVRSSAKSITSWNSSGSFKCQSLSCDCKDESDYNMDSKFPCVTTDITQPNKICYQQTEVNISHMVEVFQPLIERSVKTVDIVQHMTFIEDTGTFINRDKFCPEQAVATLLDRIRSSDEPGKWKIFMEALERAGYEHLVNVLKGDTETDHTIQRRLLRLFTPRITQRMDPQEFVDHLLAENVISEIDQEQIRCENRSRGAIMASLLILDRVPRKLENWFDIFITVLRKCGMDDIVSDMVPIETNTTMPSPAFCSSKTVQESEESYYIHPVCQDVPVEIESDPELLQLQKKKQYKQLQLQKQKLIQEIKKIEEELKNGSASDFNTGDTSVVQDSNTSNQQVQVNSKQIENDDDVNTANIFEVIKNENFIEKELETRPENSENENEEMQHPCKLQAINELDFIKIVREIKDEIKDEVRNEIKSLKYHVSTTEMRIITILKNPQNASVRNPDVVLDLISDTYLPPLVPKPHGNGGNVDSGMLSDFISSPYSYVGM